MARSALKFKQPPRELRRRVMVPARVRTDGQWSDARILNISSHGLLIQSASPAPEGSTMQILRGDHLIIARVMWSEAGRAGLQTEERLPVEHILSLKQSRPLQLIASNGALRDHSGRSRAMAHNRNMSGRAIEFVGVLVIGAVLTASGWAMAESALAAPLARLQAVLG
jgi:hypothetical protein